MIIQMLLLVLVLEMVGAIIKIKIQIPEEPPIGSKIGNLQEHLPQKLMAMQSQLIFIIMKSESSDYIDVSRQMGEIFVKKRIDREQLCPKKPDCYLTIIITCNNRQNHVELLELVLEIIDINDNKCEFMTSDHQTINWIENSRKFETKEPLNRPQDLDTTFSVRKEYIQLKYQSDLFKLDIQKVGNLVKPYNLNLVLIGELDYELKTRYQIIVEAGDGNSVCTLSVDVIVRDYNDNNPIFPSDSYHTEIPENFELFKPFYKVTAHDKDSGLNAQIFYEIDVYSDLDIRKQFGINVTGDLFLKKPLNYHESNSFKIPIIARNVNMHSRFGTTQVNIIVTDVNNNYPVITVNSAITGTDNVTILEEQSSGIDVGMVTVSDNDAHANARVTCKLQHQSLPNSIELRHTNSHNQYRLVTNTKIDREKIVSLSMMIVCHDYGVPQLTTSKLLVISVLDINDHAPQFTTNVLFIKISEDSNPKRAQNNFVIYKFVAEDSDINENGLIRYSLSFPEGPIGDNFLAIDYKTGILSSNGKLDRETMPNLTFSVIAKDQGSPQFSNSVRVNFVVLDYNDNSPQFSIENDYCFLINENNKPNDFIGQFYARDDDSGSNAQLSFKVETGEANFPFKIYAKKLSFEEKQELNKFDYEYSIEIFAVKSIDRESLLGKVGFSTSGNVLGYEFLVRAQDEGIPRLAKRVKLRILVVDSNDNFPQFTFPSMNHSQLTLSFQQRKGYRFGKINAVDIDNGINGTVEYRFLNAQRIHSSSADQSVDQNIKVELLPANKLAKMFNLDSESGDLTVARTLLRSDIGQYRLVIVARDRGIPSLTSSQTLQVNIDRSLVSYNGVGRDGNSGEFSTYYTSLGSLFNSDQAVNLYIIIAIIIASTIISVIMLSAICIVLKKSRRQRLRRNLIKSDNAKEVSTRHFTASSDTCSLKMAQSSSLLALAHIHDPVLPYPSASASSNAVNYKTLPLETRISSHMSPFNELCHNSTAFLTNNNNNNNNTGHINTSTFPQHIISTYPHNLLNTEFEQHLSNTSTDLDSGKGDSVEAQHHRFVCPQLDSSHNNNHTGNDGVGGFPTIYSTSPHDSTRLFNDSEAAIVAADINKDQLYGFFRPRFFHLTASNQNEAVTELSPNEILLDNDQEQFNTSYI